MTTYMRLHLNHYMPVFACRHCADSYYQVCHLYVFSIKNQGW